MRVSPLFMFYLAGLSVLGLLAIDMYLPAFSVMQQQLNASSGQISLSLSIFLAGYAIAQLIWGQLSDKYGRKPILLVGLSMFSLSCLAMIWIDSVAGLLVLRLIQAIGVCAAAVCWQALVIDRYPVHVTNRVLATIMPLVALSPALAPTLGAWLLMHTGWRSIFVILSICGLILIVATLFIHEVKKIRVSSSSNVLNKKKNNYWTLLSSNIFIGNVLIYAACSASFFAWLTGSPFILSKMGYSSTDIGLSYIPQTLAFLIGGYGYRIFAGQALGQILLPWLLVIYAICMAAMVMMSFFGEPTLLMLFIPFCTTALVNGAIYPIVVASALTPFSDDSGKAAALQNTIQLSFCFIASMMVSIFLVSALKTTVTVMFATVIVVLIGFIWRRIPHKQAVV